MSIKNPKPEFVTVCFQNFDSITQKLILSRLNDPQYSIELMEEPVESDLCFYNQEKPQDQDEIDLLRQHLNIKDVPMILLTDENSYADDQLFVVISKPDKNLRLSDYLSQLKDTFYALMASKLTRKAAQKPTRIIYNKHLSNAIDSSQIQFEGKRFYAQKYVGLNPDVDFDIKAQFKKIQMNPQNYLFHYLKKAFVLSRANKSITCVKTVYGTFYVDALDKVIFHDKPADEIFNIHKIPFYKDTQVFIPKFKRSERNTLNNLNQFDYEPFIWLSSINASKGKIPNNINFNAPIKLVAWPDLTKIVVFKNAIRIIALWSRGVYSLKHTGKLLNIPQRYPLTVCTALDALGLIEEVKRR